MKMPLSHLKRVLIFCCITIFLTIKTHSQDSLSLQSPNGHIRFSLLVMANGQLSYTTTYQQKEIIKQSALGIEGWKDKLSLQSVTSTKTDTTWKPVYGEKNLIHDHYNARLFSFWKNSNAKQCMQVEVRAYDEGLAFRYNFPEHPSGGSDITITKDLTEFSLPEETKAWVTEHAQGMYQLLPLSNWRSEAERPLTLELPNGIKVALAEARVVDYCRTKFVLHPSKANTITCSMYEKVELTTPFGTPWHVIMIADKETELLQNNALILNLNAPCAIKNTDWIKPGKIMREMSLSTKGAKELIDFAVKRHL